MAVDICAERIYSSQYSDLMMIEAETSVDKWYGVQTPTRTGNKKGISWLAYTGCKSIGTKPGSSGNDKMIGSNES